MSDPRFEPGSSTPRRAPLGTFPIPAASRLRAVKCVHCAQPVGISTWAYLNGFLVVCPHCRGYHGKRWGFERTLLAGFFLSAFSFFFVMRPLRALTAFVAFAWLIWGLGTLAIHYDFKQDAATLALFGVFFMGPVLVNALLLVRHQMLLDQAPPGPPASPGAPSSE